ncbi:SDR family NAD(P)-dependent oxidoreductase [Okeania hirsuta]|nr:SDR family NAD(P)-dependent oxidoreductase [Okeania hirsuta]
MGRELYQTQPLFRQTVDQCSQLLQPYLEHPLLSVIYPDTQTTENIDLIDQTAYTQPALFAIEYALCQLWQSWGIKPDILMGHSVGEYVAACIAGIFSLEDGLKLIAHRGRLMQQLPSGGQMVVVRAAEAEIKSIIVPYSEQVAIAAINGPENVVISGATPEIAEIVSLLTAKGIKTTTLKVSHGFHSPLMQEMLNSFETQARQISYHAPEIPIISNVTGERAAPSIATAEYWVNHVMKPVRFADSIKTLETEDYGIFIEIGPNPILLGMGSQCVGENKYLWLASLREEVGEWEQMLCSLGKLYVQGVDIDWTGFHRKSLCNKVLLPTYPFQRQRYWVETNSCLPKKAVLHPLLRERLHIVGLENQILFQTQLSASEPSYLNDHQVFGQPVLPAAAYLEMALAAGVAIFQDSNLILEEVNIYQALILSEKKAKTLQLILKPDKKNGYTFEIFSLNITEEQQAPVWTLHISGKLLRGEIREEKRGFDLSLIEQEYGKQMSISSFYESLTEFGMYYGSNFQGVQKLYVSQEKALSFSQLPPHLSLQSQFYQIHPILLDSCLHSGYALRLAKKDELSKNIDIYLPIELKRLKLYRPFTSQLWSQVQLSSPQEIDPETVSSNFNLFNEEGALIAEVEGLTSKRTSSKALLNLISTQRQKELQDWFYQVQWQPISSISGVYKNIIPEMESSHWLIFTDTKGKGKSLAAHLQQLGQEITLVYPGESWQKSSSGVYQINPSHSQDFESLYQQILTETKSPIKYVIHLWSLDSLPSEQLTITGLEQAEKLGCASVLHLVQSLAKNHQYSFPKLWLVTEGAQSVLNLEELAIAQTPLWGLGKVISLEHPQLWGGLIDLEPNGGEKQIEKLLNQITSNSTEDHLSIRGEKTYVARLVKQSPRKSQSYQWQSEGTYLITGGLGALGLHTAKWMVEKGVRNIVFISRSSPDQTKQAAIANLEEQGTRVLVAQADVSHQEELRAVLEQIQLTMPPLKGIIHAAGVAEFEPLTQMGLSQMSTILQPKVRGGWLLHQLTKDIKIDFFICFSSIAALWGSVGQAHYAAANHFLDGLVHYRTSIGLPGLTINWGPWTGGGMADTEQLLELRKRGIKPLSPSQALVALEQLLDSSEIQTGLANVDWSIFKELYEIGRVRLLLEEIEVKPGQTQLLNDSNQLATKAKQERILSQLKLANDEETEKILLAYLLEEIAQVLGIKIEKIELEQPLTMMGIDSLMAVELRNQVQKALGIEVPLSQFMEGLTVVALTKEIQKQLKETHPTIGVELKNNQQTLLTNVKNNDWIEVDL